MKSSFFNLFIKATATGFGAGYSPLIPGTVGTLWGCLIFFLTQSWSRSCLLFLVVPLIALSIFSSHWAEKVYNQKDCQKVVIDEVAGVMLCYVFLPYSFLNLILGFVFFRIFDIIKIFPARWAQDNLPGGWGVVGDDLMAGLQALLLIQVISYFLI